MFTNVKLSQIMTRDLVTINPEDTMDKVDEIFKENKFHHLPVVEKGKVVGIVSKADFLILCDSMSLFQKEKVEIANKKFFSTLLVKEVMSKYVARLRPEDTVSIAADFFKENLFHAIPIVDKDDQLQGIVTTYDMINYAYNQPAMGVGKYS